MVNSSMINKCLYTVTNRSEARADHALFHFVARFEIGVMWRYPFPEMLLFDKLVLERNLNKTKKLHLRSPPQLALTARYGQLKGKDRTTMV